MKILVTGAAGFIGSKAAFKLAQRGDIIVGIDNINSYYDPRLKLDRLVECGFLFPDNCKEVETAPETGDDEAIIKHLELPWSVRLQNKILPNLTFIRLDISDRISLPKLFVEEKFDAVINFAAQAGVRYSLKNPFAYIDSNIIGFMNILECCRLSDIKHLVYASSSSVYGLNSKVPFSEDDAVISPVSIYAASKKANELMAHAYGKLYDLHSTGLRYFTVYGPWGRPDMAPMLFAKAISQGKSISVFNNGDLIRDFTYIDDIVNGTIQVLDKTPNSNECPNNIPVKVYNIGCSHPVKLMDFISEIEKNLAIEAKKEFCPMQQGDVYQTNADISKLEKEIGYSPEVQLAQGIKKFVEWYKLYYLENAMIANRESSNN